MQKFDGYQIDTVDMMSDTWQEKNFSEYDVVFHVAGIAHSDNGKISLEKSGQYYNVNCELAEKTARKCKSEKVGQFIYMSSMIIFGESSKIGKEKMITSDTPPSPINAYGDSKLQAEIRLKELDDENFNIVILRPPMVYGKDSKGNYPILSKIANKLPIFPNVNNKRSMIYIENLCEFLRLLILNNESGVFMPQNEEYVSTSNMVKCIAKCSGKNIILTRIFNPALYIISHFMSVANKAFGTLTYEMSLSDYRENYRICDFEESIRRTERN